MLVDMSNILIVTPVHKNYHRPFLLMTIASVLPNIKNAEWVFLKNGVFDLFHENFKIEEGMINEGFIHDFGMLNKNVFYEHTSKEDYSLAQMKAHFLQDFETDKKWILWIDADMCVSYEALNGLTQSIAKENMDKVKLFLLTQFDIKNGKEFEDWDNITRNSNSLYEVREQFIAHHLWEYSMKDEYQTVMVDKTMSGLYCIDREWLLCNRKLMKSLLMWPKGTRGYGTRIALELKHGEKVFICPSRAYHLDTRKDEEKGDMWKDYYNGYKKVWLGDNEK